MQFKTEKDIVKALKELDVSDSGRKHYPVLFKKALITFIHTTKTPRTPLVQRLGLSTSMVARWEEQASAGLYSLEGAYAVSNKSKKLNESILSKLNQEMTAISRKISLIEEATALGLTVS